MMTELFVGIQLRVLEAFDAFSDREEGQDMIEYALLAALIAVAAVAAILTVGKSVTNVFQEVVNGFASA